MLVSQAQFAKMKSVTPAAVSQWKSESRLVIVGKMIDVEATEERLLTESRFHSKRVKPAATAPVKSPELNAGSVKPAAYSSGAMYDNPANLPDCAVSASTAIYGGAYDLAELLLARRMPLPEVREIVDAWIRVQLDGCVGGRPGLPDPLCAEDWPDAPLGFDGWHQHPLFTDTSLPDHEWDEIAEAATGGPP